MEEFAAAVPNYFQKCLYHSSEVSRIAPQPRLAAGNADTFNIFYDLVLFFAQRSKGREIASVHSAGFARERSASRFFCAAAVDIFANASPKIEKRAKIPLMKESICRTS